MNSAEIGVFGGSGFYSLEDEVREVKVDTPYGPPSDSLFLPRFMVAKWRFYRGTADGTRCRLTK